MAVPARGGLVTAGETMGSVVQQAPGSPRNGEPMTFGIGGSESNVAIGVRRLGVPATWIGRVGADPPGHLILRELRAERIEVIATTDPAPTGLMIRWRPTGMHGRVDYYRRDGAGSHLRAADIPQEAIRRAAVFHCTGITLALGPDPATAIRHAMAVARDSHTLVSFDLNYRSALWPTEDATGALADAVRAADIVFAGLEEAAIVAGTGDPAAAARAIAALGPSQVMIKLGADGCLALIDGVELTAGAPAVTVLDTVGAGDAFAAGYLAELIEGAPPARRLATAVAVGALSVTVAGDWEGLPDRAALQQLGSREPVIR